MTSDYNLFDWSRYIPDHIWEQIDTPHQHEDDHHRPLWIIWKIDHDRDGNPEMPFMDAICDDRSIVVSLVAVLCAPSDRPIPLTVVVERIPANHSFASSLESHFEDAARTRVKRTHVKHRSIVAKFHGGDQS